MTEIGRCAFLGCRSLVNIEIPNSVTEIGWCTFGRCASLTNIEIPNSVTKIAARAFSGCHLLTNIEIPNSVTEIGHGAFHECRSMTCVDIPNSVTKIEEYAFSGCQIKSFFVDKNNYIYSSENGVLFDRSKESIVSFPSGRELDCYRIPTGVNTISPWAFDGAVNLQELFMSETIRDIGSNVFANCDNLTKLHLCVEDPNLITIDDVAFKDFALDQCTLYVPIGTGFAYRHHPVFGKFKEVIIER